MSLGLMFTACDKEADFSGTGRDIATGPLELSFEDGAFTTPLIAAQNHPVGEIKVKFVGDNIEVTYKITEPNWFITETHLHIAADLAGFPTMGRNNSPQIGKFDYGDDDLYTREETYTIPKSAILPAPSDNCYFIAAHAVVVGGGGVNFEEFHAQFPVENLSMTIGRDWTTATSAYFEDLAFSKEDGESFLEGDVYDGWCLDIYKPVSKDTPKTAYSSYDLPDGFYPDAKFNQINWLLNFYYGTVPDNDNMLQDITWREIQVAIWILSGRPLPSYADFIGSYSQEMVDKLLQMANDEGSDFVPGCGEKIVIVIHTGEDNQDILITYPIPCEPEEGGETAWGQGVLFSDRGTWAMYFKVCEVD